MEHTNEAIKVTAGRVRKAVDGGGGMLEGKVVASGGLGAADRRCVN